MRRLLAIICAIAGLYALGPDIRLVRAASWTLVQQKSNSADASSTSSDVTVTATGTGNLLACWTGWEGLTGSTVTCSDGTTTFSDGTLKDSGAATSPADDAHAQWHYLLSSASGKTTIQCRWTSARTFKRCHVWEFSYSSTASIDVQNTNAATGANVTTGTVGTTGTDEIVFGSYKEYGADTSSNWQVNSVAADGQQSNSPAGSFSSTWYRILSATFSSGAATTTSSNGTGGWVANLISFKTSAVGATCPKTLGMLGVGC